MICSTPSSGRLELKGGDDLLIREFRRGRGVLASLQRGSDLVEGIREAAEGSGIDMGVFTAVGALSRAEIAAYDQTKHEYLKTRVLDPVEIASCMGNISLREGRPFVHCHGVLSVPGGAAVAGHILSGEVFAAEVFIEELLGDPLARRHDPDTGLFLWSDE